MAASTSYFISHAIRTLKRLSLLAGLFVYLRICCIAMLRSFWPFLVGRVSSLSPQPPPLAPLSPGPRKGARSVFGLGAPRAGSAI